MVSSKKRNNYGRKWLILGEFTISICPICENNLTKTVASDTVSYVCLRCSTVYKKEHMPDIQECNRLQKEIEFYEEQCELVRSTLRWTKVRLLNRCASHESLQPLKTTLSKRPSENRVSAFTAEKDREPDPVSVAVRTVSVILIITGSISLIFPSILYVLGIGTIILGVLLLVDSGLLLLRRICSTFVKIRGSKKEKR